VSEAAARSPAKKIRLFVAVDVPQQRFDELLERVSPWRDKITGARWTSPANRHVTLKFLGWTEPGRRSEIESVCEQVAGAHASGELRVSDLGAFPSVRRARVLWAGLDDPAAVLTSLANDLDQGLARIGFEPEGRPFNPHLTLVRFKTPADVRELCSSVSTAQPEPWSVRDIVLYRSVLHPSGAIYEALSRSSLG
jgi:2'-5' RNA ligase